MNYDDDPLDYITALVFLFLFLIFGLFAWHLLHNRPELYQYETITPSYVQQITPHYNIKNQTLASIINDHYYKELISKCEWNTDVAYKVMKAESTGNADAINWNDRHRTCWGSYGLFQLACFRGTPEELLDEKNNIEMACDLWRKEGWKPWSSCKNGKVKCY